MGRAGVCAGAGRPGAHHARGTGRRHPIDADVNRPVVCVRRQPGGAAARRSAAGGLEAGGLPDHSLLPEAGERLTHRCADLPVLHAAIGRSRQPAVAEHLEALQRGGRADHHRRPQAALGDQLPRRFENRGRRFSVFERRHRQSDRVRDGGTAAHQEHRLQRGDEGHRAGEGRRAPARPRHHDPPRQLRGPGHREESRERDPRNDG